MMSDRRHRGPHPKDAVLFSPDAIPALDRAVAELSWLLTRGYSRTSALALVGDRYALKLRQRNAVARSACGDAQLADRGRSATPLDRLRDAHLAIDGFNLLILLESAFSGAPIFRGRDGCLRDLASVQGTYRMVMETPLAIERIGVLLEEIGVSAVQWYLDRPVSNSGRLKARIFELASQHDWPWTVRLDSSPDAILAKLSEKLVVVSSDSWILDHCVQWTDIASPLLRRIASQPDSSNVAPPWIVELKGTVEP